MLATLVIVPIIMRRAPPSVRSTVPAFRRHVSLWHDIANEQSGLRILVSLRINCSDKRSVLRGAGGKAALNRNMLSSLSGADVWSLILLG